jgi:type IV pilus assembly protein PilW
MMVTTVNKMKGPGANQQGGFTLVDILVGLAMASVLMVAMVSLFTSMGRSYTTQSVAADAQQVARAGIDLMIQEMRMAGFNPTGTATAAIVDNFEELSGFVFHPAHKDQIAPTDANNFAFTMDTDMDGRLDHCPSVDADSGCTDVDDNIEKELIAYRINNGALEKYRGGRDNPIWEDLTEGNVSNLSFTYYDDAGAVTTVANDIRSVEISMTVQLPAGRGRTVQRTYSTRVNCRNIGL